MEQSFAFQEWNNQGNLLRASVYRPIGENNNTWVLFCHGFTGHRIGPSYLFVTIARHLAAQGIHALTFDFTGCGESEGSFADCTISTMRSDLISAYYFLKNNYQPTKIILLGYSFGGTIAALTAHTISVQDLVLLSPLADIGKHSHRHEHILNEGKNENGYYEFGAHEMKIQFLNEMKECQPVYTFSQNFNGRVLLLQGAVDEQITIEESKAYIDAAQTQGITSQYYTIENADHIFANIPSRQFINTILTDWIKESYQ